MGLPLPPIPPLPSLPGKPTTAWWITTTLGALIPIAIGVAAYLPSPWSSLILALAGSIGAALGVSHSGIVPMAPTPPQA